MTGTPTTEVPHPGPSLWTLRQHWPGRHQTTRAVAAYAVRAYTRPGDTVIIVRPSEAGLGRAVLDEVIRAGRLPIPITGDPAAVPRDLRYVTPAGRGALLLIIFAHACSCRPFRPRAPTRSSATTVSRGSGRPCSVAVGCCAPPPTSWP